MVQIHERVHHIYQVMVHLQCVIGQGTLVHELLVLVLHEHFQDPHTIVLLCQLVLHQVMGIDTSLLLHIDEIFLLWHVLVSIKILIMVVVFILVQLILLLLG